MQNASSPAIAGILNITSDSFSDGGQFLDSDRAVAHARQLIHNGATLIDIGAASSHPDGEQLTAPQEIVRLEPVLFKLKAAQIPFAIDSYHTDVQRFALNQGAIMLNDIQGFADPAFYAELAAGDCMLVVMHSMQIRGPASRDRFTVPEVREHILGFFNDRIQSLEQAGIARTRLLLDPGMGFFLGSDPECSYMALNMLTEIKKRFRCQTYISVSRKSFLGAIVDRPVHERGAASLAAELYAHHLGVDWVRTHDVAALSDALKVWHTASSS